MYNIVINNMKYISADWYSGNSGDIIGIVTVQDQVTGKIKRYIGVGNSIDEESDIRTIMKGGAKFFPEVYCK